MLKFHESQTCEGIIQLLEARECTARRDVLARDKGNHTWPEGRVEMTLRLGDQLYAIEHTGIEPFDGFMEHQNRAPELFEPLEAAITSALRAVLSPGVAIEMYVPIEGFNGRKMPEVHAIQSALVDWVRLTALTLTANSTSYRPTTVTAQPPGVPFVVSLVRFERLSGQPVFFHLKHLASSSKELRALRIQRACRKKFPKLARWKHRYDARTILVLEDNDVQLTNPVIVAETFLAIAAGRADAPDETYMVSTHSAPWYAWPLLVNGQTYFDLSATSHPIQFEMNAIEDVGVPA
jgi:hypothetical protein